MLNNQTCILCGNKTFHTELIINKPDRFEIALGIDDKNYIRKWVSCEKCGFYFNRNSNDNQIKLNEIGHRYYEIDFGEDQLLNRFNKLISLPNENSDNFHRVERIKNYLNNFLIKEKNCVEKYKILDIGSGLGVFLDLFISDEWEATAIEPDPIAYNHIEKISNGRFKVINNVFNSKVINDKFNVITFNKILEHIENPVNLLKDARDILNKENGLIYVEVPDLLTAKYRNSNDNILGSLHFNLYDPYTLSLLFKNADLVPIKVERIEEPSGKITTYGFAKI